jgi:uncharacterized protein YlxP (DUF503 family)
MFVGAGRIHIKIPYSKSLKEKRAVVNSIKRKLNNKFRISVAEVEGLNSKNSSVIGISIVSSDKNVIMSVFNKLYDFVEDNFDIILFDQDFEIMKY